MGPNTTLSCTLMSIFFAEDNLGYFVIPQSFSSYFLELINSLSNSRNLSFNSEIELENYFNFLIKSNP